jgi:hypothetical protein
VSLPVVDPFDRDGQTSGRAIELTFELSQDDPWPPVPTETIAAVLVGPGVAEIVGVPVYVDQVSVGDRVEVATTGSTFRAGAVLRPGRHSTVRVVSTSDEALREVADLAASMRLATTAGQHVLSIDVPDSVALEDLLVLLDFRSSMTLTYAVSCLRHRLTPLGLGDGGQDHVGPPDPGPDARSATDQAALALELELRGRLVRPGEDAWDAARSAWNRAVDQRPALVVEAADAFDVQAVVRFAARTGLKVAPQATGHGAAPLGDLSGAVLLRTGRMAAIDVDVANRSVRVGAGALWADVSAALAPHGLAALAGSSPDVGVAGYALGGGYSWLGRRLGLASSSITAVELVTGDGVFHRVDTDTEPDLFWAVRGGGANVGIVCTMELDVYPIPTVYAGALFFPLDRAAELLPAYELWSRDLDERATTCVRLLRLPPLPELPELLRGNAFVMIDGAVDAPVEDAEALLAPLRALGPLLDTFAPMDTAALSAIHLDPPQPVPAMGDGLALTDLTPDVVQTLLAHAGPGVESPLLTVDIRQLGGALGRRDPRGGVVDHLPGRFLLFAVGITPTPEAGEAVRRAADALVADLETWGVGQDYLNFREVSVAPGRLYPAAELSTLRSLRLEHDPDGLLVASHPVA